MSELFFLFNMREQQLALIELIKGINVRGCISGSCLLDEYYEGSDVDVFLYDVPSFMKLYYALKYNPMFSILDPLEQWKANMLETKDFSNFKHQSGVTSIKMTYNTCIQINLVHKKNATNIFGVLSSFDLDIIAKGYDIQAKKYLDLSENLPDKKVTWNRWNVAFQSDEIWQISKILRQVERSIKYYKRGYNTDNVVEKFIELIDKVQEFESIFASEKFNEGLKISKANTAIVRQICEVWLKTHEISEEALELLKEKVRNI